MSGIPLNGKVIVELFKMIWPVLKWVLKAFIWLLLLPFKAIGRLLKP